MPTYANVPAVPPELAALGAVTPSVPVPQDPASKAAAKARYGADLPPISKLVDFTDTSKHPTKDPLHQAFTTTDGLIAVVSIEETTDPSIHDHVAVIATCWEEDAAGNPTGYQAAPGTCSIPLDVTIMTPGVKQHMVDQMHAEMVGRLVKAKEADTWTQGLPIKKRTAPVVQAPKPIA